MGLPEAPVEVDHIEVAVYRAPIDRPLRTAFGTMVERPAVIVRAIGGDIVGLGEVWCNFPACGAEHRARLIESFLGPLVQRRAWPSPRAAFEHLTAQAHVLALQAGEPGPIAQAIAGIDVALWDLLARRKGMPLWRLLGGRGEARLPAYASGINPDGALEQARAASADGFCAFKLKIGFGRERDLDNLASLREGLGADAPIAVDANQAWSLDEAIGMSRALASFEPLWLEEPIAADSPPDDWRRLAAASPIPLAAGENLRGDQAFDALLETRAVDVIQPDLAKWGGISGCLPLARRIHGAGLRYCPHYLGGGIGLVASAHLLAAAGGDGMLEIDGNPNPLRAGLAMPFPELRQGSLLLGDAPGLGVEPDPAIERHRVAA